ncbi:hypothetical protein H1R20_g15052, partial [Candolleomyces eurysporus]
MVEGHFLQMGGLIFHSGRNHVYPYLEDYSLSAPARWDRLDPNERTQDGYFKLRTLHDLITKQEIEDRSKSDGLAKMVVLIQTAWFTGQFIARATQKLVITELEIITLAYTALNGVMYFFWWNKPLDVYHPVMIKLDSPPNYLKFCSYSSTGNEEHSIDTETQILHPPPMELDVPQPAHIENLHFPDTIQLDLPADYETVRPSSSNRHIVPVDKPSVTEKLRPSPSHHNDWPTGCGLCRRLQKICIPGLSSD